MRRQVTLLLSLTYEDSEITFSLLRNDDGDNPIYNYDKYLLAILPTTVVS